MFMSRSKSKEVGVQNACSHGPKFLVSQIGWSIFLSPWKWCLFKFFMKLRTWDPIVKLLYWCIKSWHQLLVELTIMWVWRLMHKVTKVFFTLRLPYFKGWLSNCCCYITSSLYNLSYHDGWPKQNLHRSIQDLGWQVPWTYPTLDLHRKILSPFCDSKKKSKEFQPTSKVDSNTQCAYELLIKSYSQRMIKTHYFVPLWRTIRIAMLELFIN